MSETTTAGLFYTDPEQVRKRIEKSPENFSRRDNEYAVREAVVELEDSDASYHFLLQDKDDQNTWRVFEWTTFEELAPSEVKRMKLEGEDRVRVFEYQRDQIMDFSGISSSEITDQNLEEELRYPSQRLEDAYEEAIRDNIELYD